MEINISGYKVKYNNAMYEPITIITSLNGNKIGEIQMYVINNKGRLEYLSGNAEEFYFYKR